jgi:hypothetical protein
MSDIRRVMLESPYRGDIAANLAHARRCALDCIERGEAPFASHLFYPQVLDDDVPHERALGILLGLTWRKAADASVFYTDRGWSPGMRAAYASAPPGACELRALDGPVQEPPA